MTITETNIPLSLYIHVPWCERKCPYCDFNSHQAKATIDEAAYIDALLLDLDQDTEKFGSGITERDIQTVFIGGGTPSLFSSDSYHRLFTELRLRLNFAPDAEITLEANPGSSEAEKFTGFRQAGINRLSIGVQSFNQTHLSKLGRVHSSQEAVAAATYAKNAGFDNFNLDLMFGLPDQSSEQAIADLRQAIELNPSHLSCYQLTIEPNTLFHHQPPVTPQDEALWDMQEALQDLLQEHSYQQYEVSAYAQQHRHCRHNLNYWHFGDYVGIGAGAHGKVTTHEGLNRTWKVKHPTSYLNKETKLGGENKVESAMRTFEYMLNALRLNHGFSLTEFEARTEQTKESISELLNKHQELGLLEVSAGHVRPTLFGHNMLNNMLEDYLAVAEQPQ